MIAIANQKGGVGKTTTAVNLATSLSAYAPTLLIDMDPQGNASTHLGVGARDRRPGTYEWLTTEASVPARSISGRLSVMPAGVDLAAAELELSGKLISIATLRRTMRSIEQNYPFIIIDCPPSFGLLTLNALVAATHLIIPIQCEFFALEGTVHLLKTVERVRRDANPTLEILGILLTMYDRRNNMSELVAADAKGFFGGTMLESVIPRNVRLSEAPSHGKAIQAFDARSPGGQAYDRLGREIILRLKDGATP